MGTHAQLGVRFSDCTISGCYVHYDGHTLGDRIEQYLSAKTITSLVLLIDKAQRTGGIRSFYSPRLASLIDHNHTPVTEFLDDASPHIIDENNWGVGEWAESYFWLIDYETGKIIPFDVDDHACTHQHD